MKIRLAHEDDIAGIAHVHVESWRTTYRNIISKAYLSQLSVERRIRNWEWTFRHLSPHEVIYVGEENGRIVGFIHGGKSREAEFDYEAELYAVYLLESAQRKGFGTMLFDTLVKSLAQHYVSMMVWVLEDNPSIQFYLRKGALYLTRKDIDIGGETLTEVALGWRLHQTGEETQG